MALSLEELYELMRDAFGLRRFGFAPTMTPDDVPGWNSLNHTVLLMEIEARTGVDLSAVSSDRFKDIEGLYAEIVRRTS